MAIFQIDRESIHRLALTSFGEAGLLERSDLQRLLRDHIDVVADDVLVIAEEFGEWTESRRRIDLLGIDKDANLVVIELKRTEDGGHMDLQALRYAAMVSTLTVERAVEVLGSYLKAHGREEDPEQVILEFLEWDELDADQFAPDVRIVLVSADFSREMTTAVLWLNERNVDIRCVRLQPYAHESHILLDVQQVIPLPETADYQVQVREKNREKRTARKSNIDFTRYDVTVNGETFPAQWKRHAILLVVKGLCAAGVSPGELRVAFQELGRGNAFLSIEKETDDVDEFRSLAAAALALDGKTYKDGHWHTGPDDLLKWQGHTFVLTNQWGRHWPHFMKALQERYPQIGLVYRPTESKQ